MEANLRAEYPSLLQLAARILARYPSEDSDDVVAIAVTKLWRAIDRYKPELDPERRSLDTFFASAYARRAVVNAARDAIRAAKRRDALFSTSSIDLNSHIAPSSPDALERQEEADAFRAASAQALSSLSTKDATVIRALHAIGYDATNHALRQYILDSFGVLFSESEFPNVKSRANNRYAEGLELALAQTGVTRSRQNGLRRNRE